ncbi:YibE/F family protein [Herbidospora sp. NBRC 101105]|uniref:YibE/F family protein n=1 Tax=Herbidospora sp. NBRC 101105 TaxID=3032195 RepID=UPI0024A4CEAC|nr:YibE/F family protein [Herbidospora sp. NBRC 101105]GLX93981.1 membrane protein [Herbidospora sp. NBRC 101105]
MGHSHGPVAPADRTTVLAVLAVILPLAAATLVALVFLWPGDVKKAEEPQIPELIGVITSVSGEKAIVEFSVFHQVTAMLPTAPGSATFAEGDKVVVLDLQDGTYAVSDHDRSSSLWLFGVAFALAVIAFGRWKGITALVGLAITFGLLLTFVLPAILAGQPPLLVAVVGAAAIMLIVLYVTHGVTVPTSVAVIGTLVSLALTGLLSLLAIDWAHLTGVTDDSSFLLGTSHQINTQGLLLASIIIGSLGVLDDVTVTQAATVAELAHANPGYTARQLYRAATRVGRAHIASVINTIVLAYAGASLPLLLLISVGNEPLGEVLAGPVVAQELVRSIVGTIGLVAAVPITTALAALTCRRRTRSAGDVPERAHDLVTG